MWRIEYRTVEATDPLVPISFGTETYPTLAEGLIRMALRVLRAQRPIDLGQVEPMEEMILVARLTSFLPSPISSSSEPSPEERLHQLTRLFEDAARCCGASSPRTPTETEPSESSRPSGSNGRGEGTL